MTKMYKIQESIFRFHFQNPTEKTPESLDFFCFARNCFCEDGTNSALSNFPGALSWGHSGAFCRESLNLRGHFRGHLRVHSHVHFREHFRERVRGSNFAVRVLCAFLNGRSNHCSRALSPILPKHG